MKVLVDLGKIADGRDALIIKDGSMIKYVLCHGYDPTEPEGQQWYWGSYYHNFASFAADVTEVNEMQAKRAEMQTEMRTE